MGRDYDKIMVSIFLPNTYLRLHKKCSKTLNKWVNINKIMFLG